MNSWARTSASFASRLRAWMLLGPRRGAYHRALAELPPISGPTVVVGSAPDPTRPQGLDDTWFVVSVNASQKTAEQFGLPIPDLTIFRDDVDRPGDIHDAFWRSVSGKRSKHLVAIMGSRENHGIARHLAAHRYEADRLTELNRHVRGAVIAEMSGHYHVGLSAGVSNGIFAALLALKLGAGPVVMSGFSFSPGWHFDKNVAVPRGHIGPDKDVCAAMVARGYPIYAADASFAELSGLPLWTGSAP
jgi:hypothetical protein